MNARSADHDTGGTAVEWLTMGVLSAVILALLATTGVGTALAKGTGSAICRIAGANDCPSPGIRQESGAARKADQVNYLPVYCDAKVITDTNSLTAKVGWFSIGSSYSLMWEKLANGEVWLTVMPLNATVGADFKIGDNVKLGAGIHASFGDTYQFQSDDEAKDWMDYLRSKREENNPAAWSYWNPVSQFKSKWHIGQRKMPPPVIKAKTVGADVHAGLTTPDRKNHDFGGGVRGKVSGDVIFEKWHLWDPKKNRYWDNDSYSFKLSGEYDDHFYAGRQYGSRKNPRKKGPKYGARRGGKRKWTATVRYMYNPDGTLANIRWITTHEVGSTGGARGGKKKRDTVDGGVESTHEVIRFTQLNFDDPNDTRDPAKRADAWRQQRLGTDYIHKRGGVPPIPVMNAIRGKPMGVTDLPGLNADPFTRLMYEKGKTWEWESDNSDLAGGISTPALDVLTDRQTKVTKKAKYLAPPKNGHRDYVEFPACEASKVPKKHDWRLDGY